MSYSLFVTNLNAAHILVHPKWPQILVTASSSCCESEPNFCMPPVDCETLQCQYSKLISILIKETFLLLQFLSSNCYFQKLGSFMTKKPFYPKQLTPRLELTGTAHLRLGSSTNQEVITPVHQSITSPTKLAISSTAPEVCLCKPRGISFIH